MSRRDGLKNIGASPAPSPSPKTHATTESPSQSDVDRAVRAERERLAAMLHQRAQQARTHTARITFGIASRLVAPDLTPEDITNALMSGDAVVCDIPEDPAETATDQAQPAVPDALVEIAVRANAERNHADLCHCDAWPEQCVTGFTPTTWEHGDEAYIIAAVIDAVGEQIATSIEAVAPAVTFLNNPAVAARAQGMQEAARIARGEA